MNERVKAWIENTYKTCIRFHSDPQNTVAMCYGALSFVLDEGHDEALDEEYDEELIQWWDNEMHPKFRELGAY